MPFLLLIAGAAPGVAAPLKIVYLYHKPLESLPRSRHPRGGPLVVLTATRTTTLSPPHDQHALVAHFAHGRLEDELPEHRYSSQCFHHRFELESLGLQWAAVDRPSEAPELPILVVRHVP